MKLHPREDDALQRAMALEKGVDVVVVRGELASVLNAQCP